MTAEAPPDAADDDSDGARRRIRSFVLRQGRMTEAQERAFAQHWARYGLEVDEAPRDYDAIFRRRADRVLEIGFGNGEALRHAARNEPDRDFIGIEVHRPGVGRVLNSLAGDGSDNVRVYCHDAVEVLAQDVADASLGEIRIYFPDPWPKKRHHKRRLIQPGLVELVASRVREGGLLHLATDWLEYAEHMLAVLDASPSWRNTAGVGAYATHPPWRIETHFERRGVRLGHGVYDLLHARI
jgi:tRNA (guanine-N7-)-methyltransferase